MNKTELQALITEKKAELRLLQAEVNKLLQEEWWLENPTLVSFKTYWEWESNDNGGADKDWQFYGETYADDLQEEENPDEWEERRDSIYNAGYYPGFEDLKDGTVVRNPNL